jgi:CNT family concentrative nucleoside transporter
VINEFVGYLALTGSRETLDPRSFTIATYALCGFANFGSVAIQIGGIGSLAPDRRVDFARLGLRSMVGGLLACYTTACLVGLLVDR